MLTVTARHVFEAHPDAPVALQYLDGSKCEAFASFPSLGAALQALYYDASVRRVLAVTVYAADGHLALANSEIGLLMDGLRDRYGTGARSDIGFSDFGNLADHVATLAHRLGPNRSLSIRVDRFGGVRCALL